MIVIGGAYQEECVHPKWDQLFGSGLRGAAVLAKSASESVRLYTWRHESEAKDLEVVAESYNVDLQAFHRDCSIEFQYDHSYGPPRTVPARHVIPRAPDQVIEGDDILYFGMLEAKPHITAKRLVYDPQSGGLANVPSRIGLKADKLCIVANRQEIEAMHRSIQGTASGLEAIALAVLRHESADAVIVKMAARGALVVTEQDEPARIEGYRTEGVFPIGSGDIFASAFALGWFEDQNARESAIAASWATARYCNSKNLPRVDRHVPATNKPVAAPLFVTHRPRVYLAGPLSGLPAEWMLNEARRCLAEQGLDVFSPKDDVGYITDCRDAGELAAADIDGLCQADVVFAIVTGSGGTMFELGYATAHKKRIVAFNYTGKSDGMTMLEGTGCEVYDDFATAIYATAWAAFGQ